MSMLEQYFYKGQFHRCYEEARVRLDDEVAVKFTQLFERFGFQDVPQPTAEVAQPLERDDETYPQQDDVTRLRAIRDEGQFQQEVAELEQLARTGSDEEKAQSFFTQGYLFLYAHHYDESIHCFLQAVRFAPNEAVYYGIAAQTMQRFNWSPFEVMAYLERALQLDAHNGRWHWVKAIACIQLYQDLQQELFLEQAIVSLEEAKASCRPTQKSLLQGIDNTFETIRDLLMQ